MERYRWENGEKVMGLNVSKTSLEMTVSLFGMTLGKKTENKGIVYSLTTERLGDGMSLKAIKS